MTAWIEEFPATVERLGSTSASKVLDDPAFKQLEAADGKTRAACLAALVELVQAAPDRVAEASGFIRQVCYQLVGKSPRPELTEPLLLASARALSSIEVDATEMVEAWIATHGSSPTASRALGLFTGKADVSVLPVAIDPWSRRVAAEAAAWQPLFAFSVREPAPYSETTVWLGQALRHLDTDRALAAASARTWLQSLDEPPREDVDRGRTSTGLDPREEPNLAILHALVALSAGFAESGDVLTNVVRYAFTPVDQLGAYAPKLGYGVLKRWPKSTNSKLSTWSGHAPKRSSKDCDSTARREKAWGPNHPEVAWILDNLARDRSDGPRN